MAVKQNNADSNGVPTPANDNKTNSNNVSTVNPTNVSNNVSNGMVGLPSSVGGTIKSQKINIEDSSVNMDGGYIDVKNTTCFKKSTEKEGLNENMKNMIKNDVNACNRDIESILRLIELLEDKRKQIASKDWVLIYNNILLQLSEVRPPKKDLTRFKENIEKIRQFFALDHSHHFYYLSIVCNIVMKTDVDEPSPSCAIAIIFQLFSADMVYDAVQSLLDKNYPNENIKQTVRVLCEWMCMCTFCPSLNTWIYEILCGLETRKKYDLFDEICLKNIEPLFMLLMVPIFRPKVAPVVFHMLSNTQLQEVFHKIIPNFGKVFLALQQQNNLQDQAEETKQTMKQLINITRGLLARFRGYDELYKPLIESIKDNSSSFDYVCKKFTNSYDGKLLDVGEHCDNVKVGLVNLGNTCYMNSVLQALAMTKEFAREIIMYECASPLIMKMRLQIALMLYSQRCELTPSRVLNATRPPGFAPGVQQDSSEFLVHLLETLHEQDVGTRKTQLKQVKNEKDVEPMAKSAKQDTNEKENDTISTIDKIFTGKLATTYKCLTCGWTSCNVDSFRDLQLSFPEVDNDCVSNYSVQDLIDYYCSPEKLDGDNQYFCERCKKLSDAERYMNVISAPKNLILTLKHFKYDQKCHMRAKLMHKVFHDEKITVKECALETLNEVNIVHYDLYAGVVHSGFSMDSGHYYTYASDTTNEWFKFNDNVVTCSKSEELHNLTPPNTPYILFYQMCARACPENDIPTINSNCEIAEKSSQVIKIETPLPIRIDDLPTDLREYINHDNVLFAEEIRLNRFKSVKRGILRNRFDNSDGSSSKNDARYRGNNYEDDDPPSSAGGCGGNALNININRFVY